jgi:hypothetical protein
MLESISVDLAATAPIWRMGGRCCALAKDAAAATKPSDARTVLTLMFDSMVKDEA